MFKLITKSATINNLLPPPEYLGRKAGIYEMLYSSYAAHHAEVHLNVMLSFKYSANNIPC